MIAAPEAQEAGTVLTILVRADPGDARDHEGVYVFHRDVEVLESLIAHPRVIISIEQLEKLEP